MGASAVLVIVTLVIGYLIWALVAWTKSTTPAKQILGMRVVDATTGQPLTFGGMAARQLLWGGVVMWIASAITGGIAFLVDSLWVFHGNSRQRLVDKMANTLIVRTN